MDSQQDNSHQNEISLSFWPKQLYTLMTPAQEVLYGGAAGPGKSWLARALSITCCLAVPGFQMFIFRRTKPDLYLSHYVGKNNFHEMLADLKLAGKVTFNHLEIKFANGSKIHGCHCFTGDTLIQTTDGLKTIKELVGRTGCVNISLDKQAKFAHVRLTRQKAQIVRVTFNDGLQIRCTPDHKFLTPDGPCFAYNLKGKQCQTNRLQLSAISYKALKESNTSDQVGTSDIAATGCTASSGSVTTELFQKVLKFTTRTLTRPTIKLKILSLWRDASTESFTQILQRQKNKARRTLLELVTHQLNGTAPRRVLLGIKSRLSILRPLGKKAFACAAGLLSSDLVISSTVAGSVNQITAGRMADMMPFLLAKSASKSLQPTNTRQSELVAKSAATRSKLVQCVSVEPAGTEDVYCLTVPDFGFFPLANGILVSNCEHESDVYNYKSSEMHGRILEETTEFTPFQIQYLGTRARYPEELEKDIPDWLKPKLPLALYATNFDDQGGSKEFLCELFRVYENWKSPNRYNPTEIWVDGKTAESEGKTRQYIPALLDDNPSINKAKYTASLMELRHPEMVRALLEGDPTVQMGSLWPELSRQKNILPVHLEPPKHLTQLYAHDWGSASPAATVWACVCDGEFAGLPRGAIYIYKYQLIAHEKDRTKGLGWSNRQIAESMYRLEPQHNQMYLTDSLPFQARGGVPMFEEYALEGIHLHKADVSSKEVSAQAVRSLVVGRSGATDLYISPDCFEVYRTMALMRPHAHKPEKPADHPEDHIPDCVQHIARAWKVIQDAAKPTEEAVKREAQKEWSRNDSLLDVEPELSMIFDL